MEEMTFDLIPIYAKALSDSIQIRDDIEKYYIKNELLYYNAARKSEYFSCYFSKQGSIISDESFLRILGIIKIAQQDDENGEEAQKIITSLFKKGYRNVYRQLQRYNFDYKPFFDEYYSKFEETSDRIFFSQISAMIFFNNNEKIFEDKIILEFLKIMQIMTFHTNFASFKIPEDLIPKISDIKKQLPRNILKFTASSSYNNEFHKFFPEYDDLLFRQVELLGEYYDLDVQNLMEGLLEPKDLDLVIFVYIYMFGYKSKKISYIDAKILYCLLLLIGSFKAYADLKVYHKKNSYQRNLSELVEAREQLTEQKEKNLRLESEIKKISVLQSKIQDLESENEKLRRQLEKVEQQLNDNEVQKDELIKLREFVYNSTEDFFVNEFEENSLNSLKATKGYIIGGHPNWTKKLKQVLPNWNFISVDINTFDTSKLKGSIVIINTSFLKHAMYYSVINEIRKNDIKFGYINNNTNIEKTLQEIHKIVKS